MTFDIRWIDVTERASSAAQHFQNAVRLHELDEFDLPDLEGYRNRMAFLHAMQSAFTCAEATLRDILEIIGEQPPVGSDSHARLLDRAATAISVPGYERPPIVPPDVAKDLHEVRRFRHIAAHNYNIFQAERAIAAVQAAHRLSQAFLASIRAFIQTITQADDTPTFEP